VAPAPRPWGDAVVAPTANTGNSKRLQKSGPGHSPVTSRRHDIFGGSSRIVVAGCSAGTATSTGIDVSIELT
jgi:hypothetical protein